MGICLGHQGIGEVYGAKLYNIPKVLHGVTSTVTVKHDNDEYLFKNVSETFQGTHYHSWAILPESITSELIVTAVNNEGMVMGMRIRKSRCKRIAIPSRIHHDTRRPKNDCQLAKKLTTNTRTVDTVEISTPNSTRQHYNMKQIFNELIDHRSLTKETAQKVLVELASGKYNPSQTTAFMTVYMMRSITVDELQGFRDAMFELCIPARFDEPVMDVCGTGGDGKNTFNMSTLSSFVVAAAGQPVAKHGNYGVSSACGSSNLLEYFGYKFTNDIDKLKRSLDERIFASCMHRYFILL